MPVESLCDREYLIYDFGVKEGETITHFDWITQKSVSSTISKIDTVEIANTLCYILIPEKMKRGVIEQYHPSFCVSSFIYFISLAK